MSRKQYWLVGSLVLPLLAAQPAVAGMTKDARGNVGYDSLAECDAAVIAGTATFYKPFTSRRPVLEAGEARVKPMRLRDLTIPQSTVQALNYQASDYSRGACEIGLGPKKGQLGVSDALQGKYIPYASDMPVNVYYNKMGQAVRVTMLQCNNRFAAAMPRPVPLTPVAMKPMTAPEMAPKVMPKVVTPVAVNTPVVPVTPTPAPVQVGVGTALGTIGYKEILGVAGALAVGAILVHNNNDNGTTGTTGTR